MTYAQTQPYRFKNCRNYTLGVGRTPCGYVKNYSKMYKSPLSRYTSYQVMPLLMRAYLMTYIPKLGTDGFDEHKSEAEDLPWPAQSINRSECY